MCGKQQRSEYDFGDRREVAYGVVRGFFVQRRVDGMSPGIADGERRAIRCRMRNDLGADDAIGAGTVVDDDRLAARSLNLGAMRRPTRSLGPAAAFGTMMRIGLFGKPSACPKQTAG
jgi:hypothetical protein